VKVTTYFCAKGASDAIEFYKKAFGAEEQYRIPNPDGTLGHAEIVIVGTTLFLSDEWPRGNVYSPTTLGGSSVSFVLEVDDVDAAFQRAVDAGASVERPIKDEPYGRGGWVTDPFGHRWNLLKSNPNFKPEDMQ
jgi:PhnB protein